MPMSEELADFKDGTWASASNPIIEICNPVSEKRARNNLRCKYECLRRHEPDAPRQASGYGFGREADGCAG